MEFYVIEIIYIEGYRRSGPIGLYTTVDYALEALDDFILDTFADYIEVAPDKDKTKKILEMVSNEEIVYCKTDSKIYTIYTLRVSK